MDYVKEPFPTDEDIEDEDEVKEYIGINRLTEVFGMLKRKFDYLEGEIQAADDDWRKKTWGGLTRFNGQYVWTDGTDIYYSLNSSQYVLNKSKSTWEPKVWNGFEPLSGDMIWSIGNNVYYSDGTDQYVLDKETSTWESVSWAGLSSFSANYIWTDGEDFYYSCGSTQYMFDRNNPDTPSWVDVPGGWQGLTSFYGTYIWSDGDYIYYSCGEDQYVLSWSERTWETQTWSGLTSLYARFIWSDKDNTYCSNEDEQYILNKETSTWEPKVWNGFGPLFGSDVWYDEINVYYSNGSRQYIFASTENGSLMDILQLIAAVEAVGFASNDKYSAETGMFINSKDCKLYYATTDIHPGDILVPGLNCAKLEGYDVIDYVNEARRYGGLFAGIGDCKDSAESLVKHIRLPGDINAGMSVIGIRFANTNTADTSQIKIENEGRSGTKRYDIDNPLADPRAYGVADCISFYLATSYHSPSRGFIYALEYIGSFSSDEDSGNLVELEYGVSTYAEFLEAYQKHKIVYCKASSSGTNPAYGSKVRKAFMAYVNDDTTPTEVEFQYYRSLTTYSQGNQHDEVHIYKLTSSSGWSYTKRVAGQNIEASNGLSATFGSHKVTLSIDQTLLDSVVGSTTIKEIKVVSELPSDAASHTDTLYLIPEA